MSDTFFLGLLQAELVCSGKDVSDTFFMSGNRNVSPENVLGRKFTSSIFGEKWLTDVTEMKCNSGSKAYLSAILDLSDKSIVAFVTGHSNNNSLVFETFEIARKAYLGSTMH